MLHFLIKPFSTPTRWWPKIVWGLCLTLLFLTQCRQADLPPLPATPADPAVSIALLLPTAGELAPVGRAVQNGILLAFDEQNEAGDELDHRLSWQLYPTDCTYESGRQAARQAVDDNHTFILGPVCTEATLGAATIAQETNTLLISPTAIHPSITVDPQGQLRPTVFTVSYDYRLQGQAAAHFAASHLNVRQAAVLYSPADPYAANLVDPFVDQFQADGGTVVVEATYPLGTRDFSEVLQSLENTAAELLYLPVDDATANLILAQIQTIGARLQVIGGDAWETGQLDNAMAEGSYVPVHYTRLDPRSEVQNWAESYKSIYAVEPDTLAALGYDAALVLAAAIRQADSLEVSDVAQSLERGQFGGVTGPITFNSRHTAVKPIPFLQIQEQTTQYETTVMLP